MTHVELENVEKRYDNGLHAVKGISLHIEPGELLVCVGPSGCGKSTLLRMVAGLESITNGSLRFDGRPMNEVDPKNRDVGMVFQNYALYPHLSVFENLAFPLSVRKASRQQINEAVSSVAAMLELDALLARKPKELSGGQRQRVALGRAVIRKPRVFLFDEPLSNLDARLRTTMRTEIQDLQRRLNVTGMYVTHDQVEAMTMGDRIAVLNQGTVLQIGTPNEVYAQPATEFVATFLGSPAMNLFEVISSDGGFTIAGTGSVFTLGSSPGELQSRVQLNRVRKVGIRPEHLQPGDVSDTPAITAELVQIEYLGHETLLHLRLGSHRFVCRTGSSNGAKIGDIIPVAVDPRHLHFFDDQGNRLDVKYP